MPSRFSVRDGFAWWLPLLTAVAGAAIAVLLSQSTAAAWDADVHLWAREGRSAAEYADVILDPAVQADAAGSMMASEDGVPQLAADQVSVELTDTLIRLTVRAPQQTDAEALALSLAHAAVEEARVRFGGESGLDLLGLVQPGARKVAPQTEWSAAWAAAVGLAVGLALATLTARVARYPRSTLGRVGGVGLRPLAVIPSGARDAHPRAPQPSAAAPPAADDDAALLTDAISTVAGIVAFVPLDAASGVTAPLVQSAQTLAAQGRAAVWLDGRRPAFELRYDAPPAWLVGADWRPVRRGELIIRAASQSLRPNGCALIPTDPLSDPATLEIARSAVGVILLARADASDAELIAARDALRAARLLGVVLTHAEASLRQEFELAQTTE